MLNTRYSMRVKMVCLLALATVCRADTRWIESLRTDIGEFPDRFWENTQDTFVNKNNLVVLALAGVASAAMCSSGLDEDIAEHFARDSDFHGFWDETVNIAGSPGTHLPVTALWYAICAEERDELGKERAWTMMTALAINGAATLGLKAIRHNDTPNGMSWSWPSGHTSSSFTVASVLHEYYGLKVGIPAYIIAAVVGYRMMDTGDHWASDVVFGGALGLVVGHTIAGKHKELEAKGFTVVPYTTGQDGSGIGVGLAKVF